MDKPLTSDLCFITGSHGVDTGTEIGLDWISLDWIGLDWFGLVWIGLDCFGLL